MLQEAAPAVYIASRARLNWSQLAGVGRYNSTFRRLVRFRGTGNGRKPAIALYWPV
jgi:hypothetical protein